MRLKNLRSPTTIDIGVKSKANYWQYTEALPIIRFRLSLGVTAKLKLYSDYPDSDGFFADFLGEVTSESLLAEREGCKPSLLTPYIVVVYTPLKFNCSQIVA